MLLDRAWVRLLLVSTFQVLSESRFEAMSPSSLAINPLYQIIPAATLTDGFQARYTAGGAFCALQGQIRLTGQGVAYELDAVLNVYSVAVQLPHWSAGLARGLNVIPPTHPDMLLAWTPHLVIADIELVGEHLLLPSNVTGGSLKRQPGQGRCLGD